jgi:hypothetical protein
MMDPGGLHKKGNPTLTPAMVTSPAPLLMGEGKTPFSRWEKGCTMQSIVRMRENR